MLTLVWRESALDDLDSIIRYIRERNWTAADRLQTRIEATAERLIEHPFMHRAGRAPATREAIVHPNYLLIYRVTDEAVEILNVVHARQEYP